MATNFSPCKRSYVLNQFPSNVMFGMNGFHVSAGGAIQGHHGPLVFFLQKYYIYIYIIGYKVTSITNSSYYATLINNNMATDFPIQSHDATRLIFVYKSDVIGVEVYCLRNTGYTPMNF